MIEAAGRRCVLLSVSGRCGGEFGFEIGPFEVGELHLAAMVVSDDNFFGVGEINSWAASLNTTQRNFSNFLRFTVLCHDFLLGQSETHTCIDNRNMPASAVHRKINISYELMSIY